MTTCYQVLWAPRHINARALAEDGSAVEPIYRREVFATLAKARRIARNRKKSDFFGEVSILPVVWDAGWREWEPVEDAEVEYV